MIKWSIWYKRRQNRFVEFLSEMLTVASAVFEAVDKKNLTHGSIVYGRRPNIDVEFGGFDIQIVTSSLSEEVAPSVICCTDI